MDAKCVNQEVDRKGSLDDRKEKGLVSGTREGKSEYEDRRVENIRQESQKGKDLKVRMAGEDIEDEITRHPSYFLEFPWAKSCPT